MSRTVPVGRVPWDDVERRLVASGTLPAGPVVRSAVRAFRVSVTRPLSLEWHLGRGRETRHAPVAAALLTLYGCDRLRLVSAGPAGGLAPVRYRQSVTFVRAGGGPGGGAVVPAAPRAEAWLFGRRVRLDTAPAVAAGLAAAWCAAVASFVILGALLVYVLAVVVTAATAGTAPDGRTSAAAFLALCAASVWAIRRLRRAPGRLRSSGA